MDLRHLHGTDVIAVRACHYDDGSDLVAVAGEEAVEVLLCSHNAVHVVAYFLLGLRVTAIAWSPRTISPTVSDDWHIELAISTHDFGLHILSKLPDGEESMFSFGGGLTGHHALINDITFINGLGNDARHLASVSDDKNLIVWDLLPEVPHPEQADSVTEHPPPSRPTALVIPFAYPLCSVSSHASSSKEVLISDSRGFAFLVDWRKDPNENEDELLTQQNIIELVHPRALAEAASNIPKSLSGYASWSPAEIDTIGAVFGSEFAIWDLGKLKGGKPLVTGLSFPEGGHKFRWCPTYPEYFAISTTFPTAKGAAINVHCIHHCQAQPTSIQIAPRPQRVFDFDWLATSGTPRLVAAVGRQVYIFPISVEQ